MKEKSNNVQSKRIQQSVLSEKQYKCQASRRGILRGVGGVVATGTTGAWFTGLATATEDSHSPVVVEEVKKVNQTVSNDVKEIRYIVKVVEYDGEGNVEDTTYFKGSVNKKTKTRSKTIDTTSTNTSETEGLSIQEVNKATYESLESGNDGASLAGPVQPMDSEGVVERHKQVSETTGNCSVYRDYSHQFKGVTVEFTQRVNDIGITTAAAAIAIYIESAGIGIAVTVIGAVIALISDTDSVTVGVNEVDTVFGTVPNQKIVGAVGYGVTDESKFVSPSDVSGVVSAGHPFH
ncbi:hypothetical protein [Halarchaeum nitratireducens]|uniref:Uncharacterized protein n=1 Tax=Halarchaeum nitratireducens TaxID=489913 RepID=A0A830GF96_9EURY|nr:MULTISPECIES: hypothetical protein [Halarchaeum]MBP2251107.1 hypothetical protein [Halarchaeum solikamskense]GGN22243.1 hypothetical protein GCM10009021_24690 [Halarchaeum nitratireducens]